MVIAGFAFVAAAYTRMSFRACPWFVGSFALGIAAADLTFMQSKWKRWALPIVVIGSAVMITLHFIDIKNFKLHDIIPDVVFSVLFSALLIHMSDESKSLFVRFFSLKPLLVLGEFSYSLYLIHMPLLIICSTMLIPFHDGIKHFLCLCLALPLVVLGTYGFHLVFERPFMRWKHPAETLS
jgi:peptidoglycan/LPS O-acetylase OafA/YrhL